MLKINYIYDITIIIMSQMLSYFKDLFLILSAYLSFPYELIYLII